MRTARILKYVAFTLMTLFGLLGGLFAAGYALENPGGGAAALMIASWVVPVVALAVVALKWPGVAVPLLAVLAVLAVGLEVASALRLVDLNAVGPVGAVSTLGLGVATGFLGLRRSTSAGLLLMAMALAELAVLVVGAAGRGPGGPGVGAILGGSSGVVVVPLLAVGVLFLVSGSLGRSPSSGKASK